MPFQVDMNFQHVQIVIAQDYKPGIEIQRVEAL